MIFQTFQTIEWMIIKQMMDYLRYEEDTPFDEWIESRLELTEELNSFVIQVLAANRNEIQRAIEEDVEQAYQLINSHLESEFGVEADPDEEAAAVVALYLNRDAIRPLYGTETRIGTVESAYRDLVNDIKRIEIIDDELLSNKIKEAIENRLSDGLKSGFFQKDGKQWTLRRVVSHIEKRLFTDSFNNAFERLRFRGVELVKVFKFVNARDACVELQASGTICIVPRNEASEEALLYPNIHDTHHKYGEPDGHRGINCRHAWHHVDAETDRTDELFNPIDELALQYEVYKLRLKNLIHRYIQ